MLQPSPAVGSWLVPTIKELRSPAAACVRAAGWPACHTIPLADVSSHQTARLPAAQVFVENTGLAGQMTPEEFVAEREAALDKLFPYSALMPGAMQTLCFQQQQLV